MSAEFVNFSKARFVSEAAEDAALLAFFNDCRPPFLHVTAL